MYENPEKNAAWHTSFYYLGEHLRALSGGAINHKKLFDLVGDQGAYFNHGNPLVRKRTAGALSRIVHSDKYVASMQRRFEEEKDTLRVAGEKLCSTICEEEAISHEDLLASLLENCLGDVVTGLRNERENWGRSINMLRVECEADALFTWACEREMDLEVDLEDLIAHVFECILMLMAFGHLEDRFAESLLQRTTELRDFDAPVIEDDACGAWLARCEDFCSSLTGRRWHLNKDRPFTIGRFTTSDAIETAKSVSRLHCRISYEKASSSWFLEDCDSHYGTTVIRLGQGKVFDSLDGSGSLRFPLCFEDRIELADGAARYLFMETGPDE